MSKYKIISTTAVKLHKNSKLIERNDRGIIIMIQAFKRMLSWRLTQPYIIHPFRARVMWKFPWWTDVPQSPGRINEQRKSSIKSNIEYHTDSLEKEETKEFPFHKTPPWVHSQNGNFSWIMWLKSEAYFNFIFRK